MRPQAIPPRRAKNAIGHGVRRVRFVQRGAATLIVVMVLFFIMSLVAAYTSRNLIFEQRTSVNQYRGMQAQEAAEAGVEWALAQLNGGRINGSCLEAGVTNADTSFRQRYLAIDTNPSPNPSSGMVSRLGQMPPGNAATPRRAGCVWGGNAWVCSCPSDANPALAVPAGTGIFPAFWVSFNTDPTWRPGVVQIISNGCTRVDAACLASAANATTVEGRALVTALVALKGAVATPPAAALTVFGLVDRAAAIGTLSAYNTDVERGGVTIHASGTVGTSNVTLGSVPGTPGTASVASEDPALGLLLAALPADLTAAGRVAADRVFASTFGVWPNASRLQPGAVRLTCPAVGCRAAVANAVALNPDRVIWVDGDLTLESAGVIGSLPNPADTSVAGPAVIVVTGNLIVPVAGVRVFGMIYTRSGNWTGSGEIQGAAIVEGNLAATAAQTIVFNGDVLDTLRLRAGSFVRVPGGWRDFP